MIEKFLAKFSQAKRTVSGFAPFGSDAAGSMRASTWSQYWQGCQCPRLGAGDERARSQPEGVHGHLHRERGLSDPESGQNQQAEAALGKLAKAWVPGRPLASPPPAQSSLGTASFVISSNTFSPARPTPGYS